MKTVAKLHGIQNSLIQIKGHEFPQVLVGIMGLFATISSYSRNFHPQRQGIMKKMNMVLGRVIRYTLFI